MKRPGKHSNGPFAAAQSDIERLVSWFIAVAVLAFFLCVAAYAFKFGWPVHFAWSTDPEDWEHFGAYLGGTLGPIYALLAFVGVLMTVALQRRQIDDLRAQSTQQALQQLLATVSTKIDDTLRAPPTITTPETFKFLKDRWNAVSVERLLSVGGRMVVQLAEQNPEALKHSNWVPEIKDYIGPEANALCREMDQLIGCLESYLSAGGSESIEAFYIARYAKVVTYLSALEFKVTSRVAQRFGLTAKTQSSPAPASSPQPGSGAGA
jgi:hypothetical protein